MKIIPFWVSLTILAMLSCGPVNEGSPATSNKTTNLSRDTTLGWWLTEPISLLQTNLRETDSGLDAEALINGVKNFPANTLLFSFGGITAHYPTQVDYHYPSKYLPQGRDLAKEVLELAHRSNIRVIARFDFSRTKREVYDAHPEWFFRQKDGAPIVDDNDLYSICINGGYYHQKALEILEESLERYDADGYFFNWFGNIRTDYKNNPIGLCHCAVCEKKFQEKYGRAVPDEPDAEYNEFIAQGAYDMAKKIGDLIHRKRPGTLFMTYVEEATDAYVTEADFYKFRPLPQWIYTAGERVNSELNTRPGKMVFDLVMPYQEMKYRFASVPGQGLRTLLYQNIAHGAFPAFVVLGTMDQPDMTALNAVQPVFHWYEKHQKNLHGQKSVARVILYADPGPTWSKNSHEYRGFYQLLSQLHIPFKVTNKVADLSPAQIDLVLIPDQKMPESLNAYLQKGGSVLVSGGIKPELIPQQTVKKWENTTTSYMRIEEPALFPSLKDTKVIFCEGEFVELETSPAPVTFIPPSQFGPPDKVSRLEQVTQMPGLLLHPEGKGKLSYIPWHIGRLYYQFGNDKHRMFIADLIDHLLPGRQRQLVTNAHPSVEITLMQHKDPSRTLLHCINMSGHAGTTFFEAIEMRDISIELKGTYKSAEVLETGQLLPVSQNGEYCRFEIPLLKEYTTIVLH